jgi:predicted dehydrogenase
MKTLRAAVIGTGSAARFHVQAYRKCPATEVIAVCGTHIQRAQAFGREFGVTAYTSLDEMLRQEKPDVVTVATLEWDHEAPVLRSLEAGCHVLCEKIMAQTLAIGENMVATARRTGRTLGVNYNYRSVPSHAIIRQELTQGSFGVPALFTATTHTYLWAHLLDLMRFFFGDPAEVTAAVVDDQQQRPPVTPNAGKPWMFADEMLYHPSVAVSAAFRYRDPDFIATVSGSARVPHDEHFWSFALYGTRAALAVNAATNPNLGGTASFGAIADRLMTLAPCSYPESFDRSVLAFVEALHEGRPAPVTGADGLAAMRLEAAVAKSAREGRAVDVSIPS